jgi:hypothetical protein
MMSSDTDTMASNTANPLESTSFSDLNPLEEFTLFPKLAAEIRLMIWGHALPGPRIITISQEFNGPCGSYGLVYTLTTEQLNPTMLSVNREARAVAFKHYIPSFYGVNGRPQLFDHSKDILHITTDPTTLWSFRPELRCEVETVQNLAYSGHPRCMRSDGDQYMLLDPFHNLQVYSVGYTSARIKKAAKNAVTTWVRKMEGIAKLDKEKASLSKKKEVLRPVVCFRDRIDFAKVMGDPALWQSVVDTPILHRSFWDEADGRT